MVIRVISFLLIIGFLTQDIAWSYPDAFVLTAPSSQNNKLAIETSMKRTDFINSAMVVYLELKIERAFTSKENPTLKDIEDFLKNEMDEKNEECDRWIHDHVSYTGKWQKGQLLVTIDLIPGYILRYYNPSVLGLKDYDNEKVRMEVVREGVLCKELVRIKPDVPKISAEQKDVSPENPEKPSLKTRILDELKERAVLTKTLISKPLFLISFASASLVDLATKIYVGTHISFSGITPAGAGYFDIIPVSYKERVKIIHDVFYIVNTQHQIQKPYIYLSLLAAVGATILFKEFLKEIPQTRLGSSIKKMFILATGLMWGGMIVSFIQGVFTGRVPDILQLMLIPKIDIIANMADLAMMSSVAILLFDIIAGLIIQHKVRTATNRSERFMKLFEIIRLAFVRKMVREGSLGQNAQPDELDYYLEQDKVLSKKFDTFIVEQYERQGLFIDRETHGFLRAAGLKQYIITLLSARFWLLNQYRTLSYKWHRFILKSLKPVEDLAYLFDLRLLLATGRGISLEALLAIERQDLLGNEGLSESGGRMSQNEPSAKIKMATVNPGDLRVIVFAAQAGAGKTEMIKRLIEEYPNDFTVLSGATTRKPYGDEVSRRDRYFMTDQEFNNGVESQELIFVRETLGFRYATKRSDIYQAVQEGKTIIFEITDPNIIEEIKRAYPNTKVVTMVPCTRYQAIRIGQSKKMRHAIAKDSLHQLKDRAKISDDELTRRIHKDIADLPRLIELADAVVENPHGTDLRIVYERFKQKIFDETTETILTVKDSLTTEKRQRLIWAIAGKSVSTPEGKNAFEKLVAAVGYDKALSEIREFLAVQAQLPLSDEEGRNLSSTIDLIARIKSGEVVAVDPIGSHSAITAFLHNVNELMKTGVATHPISSNERVFLSESLFGAIDVNNLRSLFKGKFGEDSPIQIVSPREAWQASINTSDKTSKRSVACIVTKDDYDNRDYWAGNQKHETKATLLILGDDLAASRYIYLEGIIGLVRAMMHADEDRDSIGRYLGLLFKKPENMTDKDLLELLLQDSRKFAEIIRFKPIIPIDIEDLPNHYKADMENYLVNA